MLAQTLGWQERLTTEIYQFRLHRQQLSHRTLQAASSNIVADWARCPLALRLLCTRCVPGSLGRGNARQEARQEQRDVRDFHFRAGKRRGQSGG